MKKWEIPALTNLSVSSTEEVSDYVTICNWDGSVLLDNEDYTDPNKKPSQHPTWVWCHLHNRWHPKDHGTGKPDPIS